MRAINLKGRILSKGSKFMRGVVTHLKFYSRHAEVTVKYKTVPDRKFLVY